MRVGGKTTYSSRVSVEEFQLHQSLQTIMSTWGMQQLQMNELHQRILEQQDAYMGLQRRYQHEHETVLQVAQKSQRSIKEQMAKLEEHVSFKVEQLFSQHAQWKNQRVQDLLKQTEAREELKQDLLYSTVTQTIKTAVVSNLEKVVQHGIIETVLPGVKKSLEPVKEQIHQDMIETLAATDSLLKDSIAKMVCSQQTIDAFGMVAGNAISTSVQAAYSETFQNIIIPSFERTTQALVHQIKDAFQNGTRELLKHLDTQLDQVRQNQLEARLTIVTELQQMTDSFQSSAERMLSHVQATIETQLKSELQSSLSGMQETIARYLKDAVREEVSMAVKVHGDRISDSVLNAMRSVVVPTVQVTPDLQIAKSQILQLLQQGQMNAAFHEALCACNLEMVIFVCEKVNVSEVFEQTPCPLQQSVLLSLIQQLSVDLGSNTELKHTFIQGAMVNLDRSDPVLQEQITVVICGLVKNVDAFIEKHPTMNHSFKLLRLAAKALIR